MNVRLTTRGAWAVAWAAIGVLYLTVAMTFPSEVATIGAALGEVIARFGEALVIAAVVTIVATASAFVLGAVLRAGQ